MSKERIEELLGLLDEGQAIQLHKTIRDASIYDDESLESIAFRLRDEVGDKPELWISFYLIYEWRHTPSAKRNWEDYARWVIMLKPQVIIVAALIAKELKCTESRKLPGPGAVSISD